MFSPRQPSATRYSARSVTGHLFRDIKRTKCFIGLSLVPQRAEAHLGAIFIDFEDIRVAWIDFHRVTKIVLELLPLTVRRDLTSISLVWPLNNEVRRIRHQQRQDRTLRSFDLVVPA